MAKDQSKEPPKRTLTKRQRWTPEEWEQVEKTASATGKTSSDIIREATLKRCRKKSKGL
jgi:predicted DNA-binding protein